MSGDIPVHTGELRYHCSAKSRSYRDTVAVRAPQSTTRTNNELPDYIQYAMDLVPLKENVPSIKLNADQLEESGRAHQRSLITQFHGKWVPLKQLFSRLSKVWCSHGSLDFLELQNSFFLRAFTDERDMNSVRLGLSWRIAGK